LVPLSYAKVSSLIYLSDPASAKAVTFHKDVKMRSVTLDGDTYDPSGNLSGGSSSNSCGILAKAGELRCLKAQIRKHVKILDDYNCQLDELDNISKHYYSLKQKLELKEHAHVLLEKRLLSNSNAQVILTIDK
jgi:structural maintenance of chromosome 2